MVLAPSTVTEFSLTPKALIRSWKMF